MSLLPDWNSIESTTRWSEGLFWAGIIALVLVASAELAAHIYSNRAVYLVSAQARIQAETLQTHARIDAERERQEREIERAQSAETANVQQKLDSANAELQALKSDMGRHLFDEQTNALLKALAPFAGQKIKVWCSDTASDSVHLGREFIAVLKMAGWIVPDAVLNGPVVGGDTAGIRVAFEGALRDASQIPPGIDALIATLDRVGLTSSETLYLDDKAHGREYVLKIGRTTPPKRD